MSWNTCHICGQEISSCDAHIKVVQYAPITVEEPPTDAHNLFYHTACYRHTAGDEFMPANVWADNNMEPIRSGQLNEDIAQTLKKYGY